MNLNTTNLNSINLNDTDSLPAFMKQTKAHPSRSSRYTVVATGDLVEKLTNAGFKLVGMRARKARKNDGYQAHQLVFEHPEIKLAHDELNREMRPQIYIGNSYDGTTRFMIGGGFIRFVCSNGLIAGDIFASMRQKHIGIDADEVHHILERLIVMFQGPMTQYVSVLKSTEIGDIQRLELARQALALRFADDKRFVGGEHHKLLNVIRPADAENTLWNVLNRIQENLGLNYRQTEHELKYQVNITDPVTNVVSLENKTMKKLRDFQRITELNRELFNLADQYLPEELLAKIKIAA